MIALAAAAAVLVGLTLGLLGAGGSITTVPILVYLVGLPAKEATTMSLVIVGLTSLTAALLHRREGHVNLEVAAPFAMGGVPGAYVGGLIGRRLPDEGLLVGFAVFMIAAAIAILGRRDDADPGPAPPSRGVGPMLALTALCGAAVGALTGVLGAGGGFLIVPALVVLMRLPMRQAIGSSLAVITVNCATGFAARADTVAIRPGLTAVFASVAIGGAALGHRFGRRLPAQTLRVGFAALVLVLAIYMLLSNAGGLS